MTSRAIDDSMLEVETEEWVAAEGGVFRRADDAAGDG